MTLFGPAALAPYDDQAAYDLLDQAIGEHRPTHVFALFSGGHDSVCATFIAAQHPRFSGVVHVNTGIGIEETRQYVRDLCRAQGWPLLEMHPPEKTYRDAVLEDGFPGPAAHQFVYVWLKERTIDKLVRDHKSKRSDRIALVTGIRKQESARRKLNVAVVPVRRDGAKLWVNPIIGWRATDRLPFMAQKALPRNRVVDLLHMSGECLCGAYAQPGEREILAQLFPNAEKAIADLEAEVRAAGIWWACRWGQEPLWRPPEVQLALPLEEQFLPLCVGCDARRGLAEPEMTVEAVA